jgi:transposase
MTVPKEIEDEEHEQVLARVAAAGVAKSSGMACTRVPRPGRPGKRRAMVREVSARTGWVLASAEDLAGEGIEMVTLGAASDYWRIWVCLLESAGLSVQLVSARDVRNVPGRSKAGRLDSVWLA